MITLTEVTTIITLMEVTTQMVTTLENLPDRPEAVFSMAHHTTRITLMGHNFSMAHHTTLITLMGHHPDHPEAAFNKVRRTCLMRHHSNHLETRPKPFEEAWHRASLITLILELVILQQPVHLEAKHQAVPDEHLLVHRPKQVQEVSPKQVHAANLPRMHCTVRAAQVTCALLARELITLLVSSSCLHGS